MEHPFIATLTRSGPVGQTILGGLVLLSIYTWAVILSKSSVLSKAVKSTREFLALFAQAGNDWLRAGRAAPVEGPLAKVFDAGLREFLAQRQLFGGGVLSGESVQRIEKSLEAETSEQINELEKGLVVLAIGASASPFIGLFGTVWGIMNAFRGMSLEGSAGIAAVAPGVAEALVTTVAGLAVAIPAVIAYNVLNRRLQLITTQMDGFATEFVRVAQLSGTQGNAPPPTQGSVFARRGA